MGSLWYIFSVGEARVLIKEVLLYRDKWRERVMVFNATFNNISAISWPSVLLVEETGENLCLVPRH
jgi:hypothetical protein